MRLFIALPLTQPVKERLGQLILLLSEKGGSVKWVAPENIHLTVRFLGDTDDRLVPVISENIDAVASQFQTFETMIDRLGGFPSVGRPRVIWAGIENPPEKLSQLAIQMEHRVRKLRFEPEKKTFRSHLTLGRVRRPEGLDQLVGYLSDHRLEPIPILLDRLCLFKSTLTPSGPIYERLHEARLDKPSA